MKINLVRNCLFYFLFCCLCVSAEETQPVVTIDENTIAAQTQTSPQTQTFLQTQSSQTQPKYPFKVRLQFGPAFNRTYELWGSTTRSNAGMTQNAYCFNGDLLGSKGLINGQISFAPNSKFRNTSISFTAANTLGHIGPVGIGSGVRYWYVKETQERFKNKILSLYVRDRRHIGFLTVNGVIGKFNSNYSKFSLLIGTVYGSSKTFVVVGDKKMSENMLNDALTPAYGLDCAIALRQDKKLSFSGSILWIHTLNIDWSGNHRSGVMPNNNVIINGSVAYALPWHFLHSQLKIGVKGNYVNNNEFLAEKSGVTTLAIFEW